MDNEYYMMKENRVHEINKNTIKTNVLITRHGVPNDVIQE